MDVVVVGAGLAGLTTAYCLHQAGTKVRLLEASAQIGGRICALRDVKTNHALADLGPTWVWPKYQPVAARWIKSLALETFEQFNRGDAVLLGYGSAPVRQPLPGQDGMMRIVGGPSAFIDGLARRLDGVNTRVSAPVVGLFEDGPDRVSVHLASDEVISSERIVVAIPLRVAAANLHMPWAPQALLDAMHRTPTWMSTQAKAVALYDRAFWRDAGLAGRIASRTGPLIEAHDHSGADGTPAAIFGFVGWPPQVRQNDPDGLKRAILKQLADCFGPAAAHPKALVVQDWATSPHIVTEIDLAEPPNHPDVGPARLRQPYLGGRVRFAVSETSRVSPGLIEGALAAGEQAAMDILNKH
jgi:monoamine oxidase